MAPVVSTLKKQSHPLFSQSPFDIINVLDPIITPGSSYGQLLFDSTLTFLDLESGEEINMKTRLQGYGSSATSLLLDKIYLLSGRVIAPNTKTPPVFYYNAEMTLPMGDAENYTISLANKAGCYGFGIIVSKMELDDNSSPSSQFKNLVVVMKHTDYENQSNGQVSFHVLYKVPGNRNLAKTFGLFQIGREMVLSGYFANYSISNKMLEVNVLLVLLSSGYDPLAAAEHKVPGKSPARQKAVQIDFSDENPTISMPVPGPSSAHDPNNASDNATVEASPAGDLQIKSPVLGTSELMPKKRKYNKKPKPEVLLSGLPDA
ncbi:hypothetical protein PTTG_25219 [Puccinia triticina 1-1 BBBD Race 1]|uniref:Uncharacterized protein n=1 Tax=Puccinia triticina (isolate 1-1 / race 1 (BBBD)) TaxID=630390 RepID=A0A180H3K8_PUCT1|nr:hypothetical protein PTTG_25219 [Puccinia triticina 1-1 BBBD Race 1]